jgi:hypothetical protein
MLSDLWWGPISSLLFVRFGEIFADVPKLPRPLNHHPLATLLLFDGHRFVDNSGQQQEAANRGGLLSRRIGSPNGKPHLMMTQRFRSPLRYHFGQRYQPVSGQFRKAVFL